MAEYSHLSEPDPEFAPYVARLRAIPQIYEINARRKQFDSLLEPTRTAYTPGLPKDTEYRLSDHQVDVENGKILVRSLIPVSQAEEPDKTYPLLLWIHGGGWTQGSHEFDDLNLRAICVELQMTILNVEYRLAPEHPHPTGLNDCYSVLKWAASSPKLLCADLKKGFIIGGISAGGHLATVVAHRARDDPFFKDNKLTGQLLQVPALLNPKAVPEKYKELLLSYEQNKDGPLLTKGSVTWAFEQLGGSPEDPEVSPLLYPSHKGLVPTVIQVCGMDALRDEDFLYEKLLNNDGVQTKTTVYPGVPHAFHYSFSKIKMAVKWEEDFRSGLRWLLAQ
ncbi:Alpha/Beta hydrolase protein [Mycena epipterygia]|nr:Alpha/Beta hydrolase protein [Mycena epipterygia]